MLMTSRPILAYKISSSWSNSPHSRGGFITIRAWYLAFNLVEMEKFVNKTLENNQYPLVWFKMHYFTTRLRVSIIVSPIAHVEPKGTPDCNLEVCRL
jgi:hypothetical protein